MTTGWLIYSKKDAIENNSYIEWFIEEASKQHLQLELILRESLSVGIIRNQPCVLLEGKSVKLPNFSIVRTVEPLLNKQLEELGMQVFNSSRISEICNNKAKTYIEVMKLGIPMVDTLFMNGVNFMEHPPLPFPFVLKDVMGRGGSQVYYIESEQQWNSFRLENQIYQVVLQNTNVKLGKDLRVFVVGKEIIGAVLRESNSDFRANFKLGGTASLYLLNRSEETLIQKIIDHFDFGMVGIDFLIGHNGELLFNEIEDVVGSRTLSAVSSVNILEKYITHIKTKMDQDT
ncbi:ATP-grasp domain-containing protein [Ornithinibacillus scapharcae]|uniref:ATP-grasp domain-containing protein n=1 Tax=Ornithinibacillus scapharcae TaxID=1147159 RepID=UPI000225BF56|nr:ATP-grasp domain-containing protein [Ornithinibacillus scapharcae]